MRNDCPSAANSRPLPRRCTVITPGVRVEASGCPSALRIVCSTPVLALNCTRNSTSSHMPATTVPTVSGMPLLKIFCPATSTGRSPISRTSPWATPVRASMGHSSMPGTVATTTVDWSHKTIRSRSLCS